MSNYPLATSTWDNKELEAIQSIIDSDNYTMGNQVSKFEHDFGKFINRKYCLMVSSGSAANLISIASFFYTKNQMLKKGDEVITQGGLIGSISKVSEHEVTIDFGDNISIKAVKSTLASVKSK